MIDLIDETRKARIAAVLKHEREQSNHTQESLAKLLHKAKSTVNEWEKKRRIPDSDVLLDLCELYDCDLAYLVGEQSEKRRAVADIHDATGLSSGAINKLCELSSSMPENDVEKIVAENDSQRKHKRLQFEKKEKYIIAAISYMLTDGYVKFEKVAKRLISLNHSMYTYYRLLDIERSICAEAFLHSIDGKDYRAISFGKKKEAYQEYCSYIDDYLINNEVDFCNKIRKEIKSIEHGDGISNTADVPNDLLIEISRENMTGDILTFFCVGDALQNKDYIDFVNMKDLYDVICEFNESAFRR